MSLVLSDIIHQRVFFPIKEPSDSEVRFDWIFKDLDKHLKTFQVKLIQKLIPSLLQEGYQEINDIEGSAGSSSTSHLPERVYYPISGTPCSHRRAPFEIGRSDLDILEPVNPGGGMIFGPNHPGFYEPLQQQDVHSQGFLPHGAVPPGARFDPISPIGPSVYRPSSNRPPDFYSGEPDSDELLPPGMPSRLFPSRGPGVGGFFRPPF